jgi:hypothetical protein
MSLVCLPINIFQTLSHFTRHFGLIRSLQHRMHIRLCAITRVPPPTQNFILQRTLANRPSVSLAIHSQEVSIVQRDIARWLHRGKEL